MARSRDFVSTVTSGELEQSSEGIAELPFGNEQIDGTVDALGNQFDPERHAGIDRRNRDGSFALKRGRKSGSSGNSDKSRKVVSPNINSVEQALIGIHSLLALTTKTPELLLEADESKPLAQAVSELAKHYDIPGLDAKAMAWAGLIMVAGKVYVPRAVLINQRIKENKATKKPNNVVPIREKPQVVSDIDPLNPPIMM